MKMFRKLVCICLILVIGATSITPTPAASARFGSYWSGFAPIRDILGYSNTIYLTISGDMVFEGFFGRVTEEELNKLCQEVLEYLGETAESVYAGEKAYKKLVEKTQEMFNEVAKQQGEDVAFRSLIDAIVSAMGNATIGGSLGVIYSQIENGQIPDSSSIISLITNSASLGAGLWAAAEHSAVGFTAAEATAVGADVGFTASVLIAAALALDEVGRFKSMVKGVMELEQQLYAYTDFLDILRRKLANCPEKIVFDNAKAQQTFSLFGQQCTEKWTLNMTLVKTTPAIGINTDFRSYFEGSYAIDIEYDLSAFQDSLQSNIWNMGQIGQSLHTLTDASDLWNLVSEGYSGGSCNVTRKLSGQASAYITIKRTRDCTITPKQESDKKDVGFSGHNFNFNWFMKVSYEGLSVETDLYWDMDLKADEDGPIADLHNGHGTSTNNISGSYPFSENPFTVSTPWEGTMWDRGDKANSNWKISIVPMGKK